MASFKIGVIVKESSIEKRRHPNETDLAGTGNDHPQHGFVGHVDLGTLQVRYAGTEKTVRFKLTGHLTGGFDLSPRELSSAILIRFVYRHFHVCLSEPSARRI